MLSNHDSTAAKSPPRTARRGPDARSSAVVQHARHRPPRVVHNLCMTRRRGHRTAISAAVASGREGSGTTYTVAHAGSRAVAEWTLDDCGAHGPRGGGRCVPGTARHRRARRTPESSSAPGCGRAARSDVPTGRHLHRRADRPALRFSGCGGTWRNSRRPASHDEPGRRAGMARHGGRRIDHCRPLDDRGTRPIGACRGGWHRLWRRPSRGERSAAGQCRRRVGGADGDHRRSAGASERRPW